MRYLKAYSCLVLLYALLWHHSGFAQDWDTGYLGIYNQRGQLIYTREFSGDLDQSISFRQYGTGYYYARLVAGNESHMQTIIIE